MSPSMLALYLYYSLALLVKQAQTWRIKGSAAAPSRPRA